MADVMVDLETMGTGSNAVILSIGAVWFDDTGLGSTFYTNVDQQSCLDVGLTKDASTEQWWAAQSAAARNALNENAVPLSEALRAFSNCFEGDECVWGNGATFDNVILANAYKALGVKQPWSYSKDRCYRTLKSLYPAVMMERVGTHHNALDDAKSQALHAIEILKHVRAKDAK